MLISKTPYGNFEIPEWEENRVKDLSDDELIKLAIAENSKFCISPAVFALIEKRRLGDTLQKEVNPNIANGAYLRNSTLGL